MAGCRKFLQSILGPETMLDLGKVALAPKVHLPKQKALRLLQSFYHECGHWFDPHDHNEQLCCQKTSGPSVCKDKQLKRLIRPPPVLVLCHTPPGTTDYNQTKIPLGSLWWMTLNDKVLMARGHSHLLSKGVNHGLLWSHFETFLESTTITAKCEMRDDTA